MSFWTDKIIAQQNLPAPSIPQPEPPEPAEADMTQAEWMARNARRPETGSDFMLVTPRQRGWDTNSHTAAQDVGIFGRSNTRNARAAQHEAIRSGAYTESGNGTGIFGTGSTAEAVHQGIAEGTWQLAKGLDGDEPASPPSRFR